MILDRQIAPLLAFLMRYLHEVPHHERLPYILVEPPLVVCRNQFNLESFHDTLELCADVVCLCK